MTSPKSKTEVPRSMQVQFARLFGAQSKPARQQDMTPTEWKRVLRRTLREIGRYLDENVSSDDLHMMMLYSGLAAAEESLKTEDFWPGYVEGITRLALLLIGDYPDHRRKRGGRKRTGHYSLKIHRNLHYQQDENQRVRTLLSAFTSGWPQLSRNPRDVLGEFRDEHGSRGTYKQFLRWYKARYPQDYAAIF